MEKAISVPWWQLRFSKFDNAGAEAPSKLTIQPSTCFDMLNNQAAVLEVPLSIVEGYSRRIVLSGIDTKGLRFLSLSKGQSVDLAVEMNKDGNYGIPVPNYTDSISTKVVKIIQSYVGVVNKMVWRKDTL